MGIPSFAIALVWIANCAAGPDIVIAEGEKFRPLDDKGWKVTHQQDSYGSHTYGGVWMTHGGCLGAPAESEGSVASQVVSIPVAGRYRTWSKYQAPPYFNYLHKIEIIQNGKTVFSHTYGKSGTPRLWSFSGDSDELWWPWGVDHDAAESPKALAQLAAGPAEIRLMTVANPNPGGNRFVDFVVLTTNPGDEYVGFKPYAVGSPFTNEAFAATRLYARFRNESKAAARLSVSRAGHYQPQYGGATTMVPEQPVAAGAWSEWVNIGPFCRLVHNEGLTMTLPGAGSFPVQFALDPQGKEIVGDIKMNSGDTAVVPIDVTWNKGSVVKTSREHAAELMAASRKWRTANGGKKPKEILFYGNFSESKDDWVAALKDRLGYNTILPDSYEQVRKAVIPQHFGSPDAIRKLAASMPAESKKRVRVISFGDEISLGQINFDDPKNQAKFAAWLTGKGLTARDLGVAPGQAKLSKTGDPRLVWYSNLFNEEERFADYRATTAVAKEQFGADVLTGANYSPHHLALCYGPVFQWVDIFKHNGMSMFWAEDYIFSVPEVPQMLSWMLAQARCGVKYNNQPIHFYIMPHAPGQEPGFLRRNMLMAVGNGARHVDSFWVGPEERFTENYVAWTYPETFRAIHEAIHDSAEAEKIQSKGKVRPARVALVTGKATDFNESRLMVDKAKDPFAGRCKNAPAQVNQIICRKEQQLLYLALRQAQHGVDLITEDDIADLDALKNYDVVYFAGEWIDRRAVTKLDAWVRAGGVLYAAAGIGHLNEFNQPDSGLPSLLGIKATKETRSLAVLRTMLELPLLEPIDTITLDGGKVQAVGMKQVLTPQDAEVIGKWSDGTAAVTVRSHGKGKAFAVGTLPGTSWMKTGLKVTPWARGGKGMLYNPTGFQADAEKLARLAVDARKPEQAVTTNVSGVEAFAIDGPEGTLITLLNWTNSPLKGVEVTVRAPAKPSGVRSVQRQAKLESKWANGQATFTVDIDDADYILMPR